MLAASTARAQQWLSDRQRAEGHGILAGDFELHPGIGAEAGYVSNVLLSDPAKGSAAVRIAPHLFLSTQGSERADGSDQKVSFRAGVNGSFRDYFNTDLKPNVALGQEMKLVLAPSSVFAAEFFDEYVRSVDPFTGAGSPPAGSALKVTLPSFSRDKVGAGTRLSLSTPGAVFRVGLGYRFDLDYYEDTKSFGANDSLTHTISSDTSWEFLPQTALLWNGSVRLHDWTHPLTASSPMGGTTTSTSNITPASASRSNSTAVDTKVGVTGALTSRLGLTFAGGYSAGFYRNNNDFEGFVAQVSGRVRISDDMIWMLGYDRQYSAAFQGDHMLINRLSTSLTSTFAGVFVVALRGSFTFTNYGRDAILNQTRSDRTLIGNLSGEYRVVDWLAFTAEFGALKNFTDFQIPASLLTAPDGTMLRYNPAYLQLQAWGGVRAFL